MKKLVQWWNDRRDRKLRERLMDIYGFELGDDGGAARMVSALVDYINSPGSIHDRHCRISMAIRHPIITSPEELIGLYKGTEKYIKTGINQ